MEVNRIKTTQDKAESHEKQQVLSEYDMRRALIEKLSFLYFMKAEKDTKYFPFRNTGINAHHSTLCLQDSY